MKILYIVFAATVLFSAGTAEAILDSSVLYGFIKLPQAANLTLDKKLF